MSASPLPPSGPASPRPPQPPRARRFKTLRVTTALILREIASTDSRTSLGFLWQFIEPVAAIGLFTLLFQLFTRTPPLGDNFPLFYVTGLLPYSVFQSVGNKVSGAVRYSRPLLEFPSVTVIDAILSRFLLNFVIECMVFVILTASIIAIFDLKVIIDIPLAIEAMVLAGALALGIGTFNSVLFLAFPVYETVYGVLTRPLMLASGVLFQIDALPRNVQDWLAWNPAAHPVALMRGAFYAGADTSFVSPLFVILVALCTLTLGLVTLHRFFRDALER